MAREQILPSLLFALTPALSHRAREMLLSPLFTILYRDNKRHELPRPVGEGWGEGKQVADCQYKGVAIHFPNLNAAFRTRKRHL